MTEKNIRANQLSDRLGSIDEDIWEEAYRTDDAEALARLKTRENRRIALPLRRIALAAACLLLAVGVALTLPPLLNRDQTITDTDIPTWFTEGVTENLTIDSLDKLNYYAARKSLSNDTVDGLKATVGGALSFGMRAPELLLSKLPTFFEKDGSSALPPLSSSENGDIYVFSIGPEEVFTVTRVIGFQIKLENPNNINGFLESKLGAGVIDVIITQNSLETMITFRNGDRYFSCLFNGYERNENDDGTRTARLHFSTHKYIDGFSIVKNLTENSYGFYIWMNESTGDVTDFRVQIFEQVTPNLTYWLDTVSVVPGSSFVSNQTGSFTIADLQNAYGSISES